MILEGYKTSLQEPAGLKGGIGSIVVMFMDGCCSDLWAGEMGQDQRCLSFRHFGSKKEIHILLPRATVKLQFGLEVERCRREYRFRRAWN